MKSLTFLLIFCPVLLFAQVPKPKPNTYVNDLANVLTAGQIEQLNQQALALEKATSVQIAIVITDKLPDNMEIEDYAREIGRTWHVGNANNGLVYVAVLSSHKQRLEVARQLEGTIPDIEALHITDGIKPFFRKQDYFAGLFYMLQQVQLKIKPATAEQKQLGDAELAKKKDAEDNTTWLLWFFPICAGSGAIAYLISNRKRKRREKQEAETLNYGTNYPSRLSGRSISSYDSSPTYFPSPGSSSSDYSSSSGSSSSSSSDYGSWGSGSSDTSSSSDSGFSGGGSSNDW